MEAYVKVMSTDRTGRGKDQLVRVYKLQVLDGTLWSLSEANRYVRSKVDHVATPLLQYLAATFIRPSNAEPINLE